MKRITTGLGIFLVFLSGCAYNRSVIGLAGLLTHQAEDIRAALITPDEVLSLESQRRCAVWGPRKFPKHRREVTVNDGLPLRAVLLAAYGRDMGQQVKIVSKNSIVQTPLYPASPQAEPFADRNTIIIHPGDLIFVQTVQ